MKGKRIGIGLGAVAVAAVITGMIFLSPKPVLKIDETKVYSQEAMVYIAMAVQQFEEIGGPDVWELSFDGKTAQTKAEEAALESLLQAKLLGYHGEVLSSEEVSDLEERVLDLKRTLGEEWLREQKIKDQILREILQENYLVWKYKESIAYREEEIEEILEKQFGEYKEAEAKGLLTKVKVDSIIFYNGVLSGEEWVRYPAEIQQQQLLKAEEVQRRLRNGEDFESLREEYGEVRPETEQKIFYCGIWEDAAPAQYLYRGQIHTSIAGKIFKVPEGQISDMIDIPYGYLIVRIREYSEADEEDRAAFQERLKREKAKVRAESIEAFRQESLRNEAEQLKKEADIQLWEERWADLLQQYWDQKK